MPPARQAIRSVAAFEESLSNRTEQPSARDKIDANLRIATVNVNTLAGRLEWILTALDEELADTFCIQETRVSAKMAPGIIAAC